MRLERIALFCVAAAVAAPAAALRPPQGGSSSSSGITFGGSSGGSSNRVLYTNSTGKLADDADLTFDGTNLTAAAAINGMSNTAGNCSELALRHPSNTTTGIGLTSGDNIYFCEANTLLAYTYNPGSVRQFILQSGNEANPSLAFSDVGLGFRRQASNTLELSIAGAGKFRWNATGMKVGSAANAGSTLDVAGSFQLAYLSTAPATASTYTLTSTDYMVTVDATAGARQVDLPTAVGIAGRMYTIKKIDASANAVTVDANGSQTIDAGTTYVLDDQWDVVSIISDGANWLIRNRVAAD